MVLTSDNCGKYFTRKWIEGKNRCMADSTRFTQAERDYYEVSGAFPGDGDAEMIERNMKVLNSSIDSRTTPQRIDIRDRPEVGR